MSISTTILFLVIGLVLCSCLAELLLERRDRRRFPAPGRLVRMGKRSVHLLCSGERRPGQPLIVLEAGMGSWSFYWRLVQPALSASARVCSYDRLGLGWSTAGLSRIPHSRSPSSFIPLCSRPEKKNPIFWWDIPWDAFSSASSPACTPVR